MSSATAERTGEEIWESTIPGRIHVEIVNEHGRPRDLNVKGKGSRLRLRTDERQLVEERIRLVENNPFRNGMLLRVDSAAIEHDVNELSDDDLRSLFDIGGEEFAQILQNLSEVNVRRMKAMAAEVDATNSQIAALDDVMETKFSVGGEMPSYAEIMGDRDEAR